MIEIILTLSAPALYTRANPRAPASICGWKKREKKFYSDRSIDASFYDIELN